MFEVRRTLRLILKQTQLYNFFYFMNIKKLKLKLTLSFLYALVALDTDDMLLLCVSDLWRSAYSVKPPVVTVIVVAGDIETLRFKLRDICETFS